METFFGLLVVGIISRLLPHPANFTAVGASALLAGSRLGVVKGMLLVIVTMVITDLVLGFHRVMWATYGSLILTVALSSVTLRFVTLSRLVGTTAVSSVLFYLITNFAVWREGVLYPPTTQGLWMSYVAGLPFLRNSMLGDMTYSILLFGVAAFVSNTHRLVFSPRLWKKY